MKIWVVLRDYEYEGYGPPLEAYTSEEAATMAQKRLGFRRHEVCECELDPVQPAKE